MDKLSRAIGKRLQEKLGQPVVIDNRAGAGGTIAAEAAATAAPDGYTLMMGTVSSLATNVALEKLRYDPMRDFAPVILVAQQDLALIVASGLPAGTVKDLVQTARREPDRFSYSSAGRGTGGHLSGELFSQLSGVRMLHVPYKGVSQAATDVIGGQVTLTFASLASAHTLANSKKVKLIAVTGDQRAASYPDVPTMEESGITGYKSSTWYALVAPAKTPPAIVQRINVEVSAMLAERETKDQFAGEGIELVGGTPQQLSKHMKLEIDKWGKVIRAAGLDKQ
ncbi:MULTISPECIES: tripartite tricarboxylate transporter substrate-binding protein [Bacteria]|uniref:tripartite tricarboxylate transporter substrate-binding protein n=1 Tax=Acidovorax sp. SRB_24 TaxID=1962700 RepID=UPI00145F0D77